MRGNYAANPGRVRELVAPITKKELSPVDLVRRYLDRIAEADAQVQCWRQVDAERALGVAEERGREAAEGNIRGLLHGVPIAIKDIIDVEGLPTRANSRSRAAAPAAGNDAEVVLALKAQGAIVLGKVHTTEYAFFDPSPARNPHNLAHTPGGSSRARAAVASGMAPAAVGRKRLPRSTGRRPRISTSPSTRCLATFGIATGTLRHPGFYGWSVDDATYVYEAIAPNFLSSQSMSRTSLTVCIPDDPHISDAIPEIKTALARMADAFARAGHALEQPRSPISFERLFEIQRHTMAYEAGRALKHLLDQPDGSVGEKLIALIHQGLAIAPQRYRYERGEIDKMRGALFSVLTADVFLWPAAPSTAPAGLGWTGDPKYISPWTALGGPIVSVPAGFGSNGLPIGCILSSRPGTDLNMCTWARTLSQVAA
jgi:aspartyl-tRNA(Asn)/glutamyl-tRNA(Gln) amidotransferase subunit A